jgi:hypothetical protein
MTIRQLGKWDALRRADTKSTSAPNDEGSTGVLNRSIGMIGDFDAVAVTRAYEDHVEGSLPQHSRE